MPAAVKLSPGEAIHLRPQPRPVPVSSTGNDVNPLPPHATDLQDLVGLFYERIAELGVFEPMPASSVPAPYQQLLVHDHHMTVTVEAFHHCPVDVSVLALRRDDDSYSRKIVLRRQTDGAVVQFGIVRLFISTLTPEVFREVERASIPLGRVLINHEVLREVACHQLFHVRCGPELAQLFQAPLGSETFGRTALIYCDGRPSIELLEIVSPA